jgi:hypothetical protein
MLFKVDFLLIMLTLLYMIDDDLNNEGASQSHHELVTWYYLTCNSWRLHAVLCTVWAQLRNANMLFSLSSGRLMHPTFLKIWRAKRVLKTDGTWQTWLSKGKLCYTHMRSPLHRRCRVLPPTNHLLRLVLPFYHSCSCRRLISLLETNC